MAKSLRSVDFSGEAENISTLGRQLVQRIRRVVGSAFGPGKPFGDELPYEVARVLECAVRLQMALLEAEVIVLREDAVKRLPRKTAAGSPPGGARNDRGGKSDDSSAVHPQADQGDGGRRQSGRPANQDLRKQIREYPSWTDKEHSAQYNKKYGRAIGEGKRKKITPNAVKAVRLRMKREASKHDS